MKTIFLSTLVIPTFIAVAGVAGIAHASNDNQAGMEASYLTQAPQGTFHSDSLTGNQVKSSVENDEDIGTINDLIIDENGQITAVVVGVGGFLGMGEKDVAIEWGSLELTKDEDGKDYVISVNASQEALKNAEEYERGNDLHTERDTEMNSNDDSYE